MEKELATKRYQNQTGNLEGSTRAENHADGASMVVGNGETEEYTSIIIDDPRFSDFNQIASEVEASITGRLTAE